MAQASASVPRSRSARVFLCFGLAAAFSFTVGRGCEGGGVPMRARAFALTALTAEKTCFFDLDLLMAGRSFVKRKATVRAKEMEDLSWYSGRQGWPAARRRKAYSMQVLERAGR